MRQLVLALGVLSVALPVTAHAHFNLLAPPSSNTANATEGGKGAPPCGPDTAASSTPTAIQGGQAFTLKINETVFHPGFYRVALALHSRSELPADPVVLGANMKVLPITGPGNSVSADGTDMAYPVLANDLFSTHTMTGPMQAAIKIPNVNCDKCTLQVIEFMANHGPNPGGGYFYHHCADLKITADPNQPIEHADGGAGGAGGAGAAGASTGGASGGASAAAGSVGVAGATESGGGGGGGVDDSNAGAGGLPLASAGAATAGAATAAGAGVGGASAAGASTSSAGSPSTSSAPTADPSDNGGGCSLGHRASGSAGLLSLLIGLFALGRRRRG